MESNYSSYQNGGKTKSKTSKSFPRPLQLVFRKYLKMTFHPTLYTATCQRYNGYIKDLSMPTSMSQSEQRQRKMQRERLQDEFTATLNAFQQVQRSTAAKEKDQINKAKAQIYGEHHLRKNIIHLSIS
nr:unnamed protein product [Callosobruchus analis]